MCLYSDVLGSGETLVLQFLTFASVALSIVFWVFVYERYKVKLEQYLAPIVLWIIFGTLDILITAKGTFNNPWREANPLAEFILVYGGYWGPVIGSVLWIGLWAGIVLLINKKVERKEFFSLAIFYSLALGHFLGFSSWFYPFCPFDENFQLFFAAAPEILKIILVGMLLSLLHLQTLHRFIKTGKHPL